MKHDFSKFLVACVDCGCMTNKQHAKAHGGKCKACVEFPRRVQKGERQPPVGSAEWCETRGDDLGLSPDF